MLAGSHGCRRLCGRLGSLSPRKENFFQESEKRSKQKCRHSNGDDPGIDQIRLVKLFRRLDHGAHATIAIHNLGQYHVGPANVVKNTE